MSSFRILLSYCKDNNAEETFREIRSCIGSYKEKNQIATLHNNIKKASVVLSLTSINGISNLDFVIVSYKKTYLAVWLTPVQTDINESTSIIKYG